MLVLLFGCNGGKDATDHDANGDADADTDADADSDADADADTDLGPDGDGDGSPASLDCDDTDPAVFPGAPDLCGDDKVTNCDRSSDDGLITLDGSVGYANLQTALDAASPGSELVVCPGDYVGNFVGSVPVRVTALEDAGTTKLSGGGGTTLTVVGGTELVGFTIRNGKTNQGGGGLLLTEPGTLLVDSCVITENDADFGGGLLVPPGATATLVNTVISDNHADQGGGGAKVGEGGTLDLSAGSTVENNDAKYFGGGVWLDGAHLVGGTLDGNSVQDYFSVYYYQEGQVYVDGPAWPGNALAATGVSDATGTEVTANFGEGAAVSITFGELALTDVSIHDNSGYYSGGLVAIAGAVTMLGTSAVTANSGYYGGGAFLVDGSVTGGTFSGNEGTEGGGVFAWGGDLTDTVVSDNVASYDGGGVFSMGNVNLDGVTIEGNTASGQGGGVGSSGELAGYDGNELTVTDSVISGNEAARGGGLSVVWALHLIDTVVSDNAANTGGGLQVSGSAALSAGSVVRNVASSSGGGIRLDGGVLTAVGTDLGEGVDDNVPADVRVGNDDYVYGVNASFECNSDGCSP